MKHIIIILVGCMPLLANAQIQPSAIKTDVTYLASDRLEGRSPGSKGEQLAYEYIIKRFEASGILPKGEVGFLQKFTYQPKLSPHDTVGSGAERSGTNVIGYIDNGAKATIVIGAHYDHLGTTGEGSSLESHPENKIHNGADDNASGVAGVLALAQYYHNNDVKEPVNFVFALFSAEEAGLIGSKYLTNHPTWNFSETKAMINFDMIGRLKTDSNFLMVYGTGTSPAFETILKAANHQRFQLRLDSSGVGPSDQTSFYLKNIPVLHFFTGQHKQYHRPEDDTELINFDGEAAVLNYVLDVMQPIMQADSLPFTPTRSKQADNVRLKVTMGVMPDYAYSGTGMRIDGVTDGKPAAQAGLQAGDVILKIAGREVTDIYAYMGALNDFKKGDTAPVIIQRDGKELTLQVTF